MKNALKETSKFAYKKLLEKILKTIDKVTSQSKTETDKIIYDFLVQNIKEEEFMRTFLKLKELDFAESAVMKTLFEYK